MLKDGFKMGPELGIHPRVSFVLVVLLMCTHFFTSLSLSPSYTHTHTHLSLRGLQTAAREKIGQKRWSQRPKEPFCHFVSLSSIWYCSFVRASQIKAVYNSDLKDIQNRTCFSGWIWKHFSSEKKEVNWWNWN